MGNIMKNPLALVTGAGRGIGKAIAVRLAKDGYTVVVNYRNSAVQAEETAHLVQRLGGKARTMGFNVTDPPAVDSAIKEIIKYHGSIDVLVNNAGIAMDGLFVSLSMEKWQEVIDTALKGFYLVTKPVLKQMIRNSHGSIVSIASAAGLFGNRGQANYAAAKAGLIAATLSVARESARFGVRANVVAPGFIATDMTKDIPHERIIQSVPMERMGRAEEVADAVGFLVSDQAAYITGQVLSVNGGMV